MLHPRFRQVLATLAILPALAGWADAQEPQRLLNVNGEVRQVPESKAMRFLMDKHAVHFSGKLSCCRMGGCTIYHIGVAGQEAPACVIICKPGEPAGQAQLAAAAERYQRLSRDGGYRMSVAEDGSAAFLLRETGEPLPRPLQQPHTVQALTEIDGGLMTAMRWLQAVTGGDPLRLEGSSVVWSMPVKRGEDAGEAEFSLELLRGVPACIGLRLKGIHARHAAALSEQLFKMPLEAPARPTYLKSCPGVRLVGQAELQDAAGERLRFCMLQPWKDAPFFCLGERTRLLKLCENGQLHREPELPALQEAPWADELPLKAPKTVEAPARLLTPAEARSEYARQLRAL